MEKQAKTRVIETHSDNESVSFIVAGVGTLGIYLDALSNEIKHAALVHGLKARIVDAAALSRDSETGASATPQQKFDEMEKLVNHYNGGATEWNFRSGGERKEGGEGGLVLRALAAIQGLPVETMRAKVKAASEKRGMTVKGYLAGLSKQATVAAKVLEIRQSQPSSVDADDLLGELSGD